MEPYFTRPSMEEPPDPNDYDGDEDAVTIAVFTVLIIALVAGFGIIFGYLLGWL